MAVIRFQALFRLSFMQAAVVDGGLSRSAGCFGLSRDAADHQERKDGLHDAEPRMD